jgi:hypothetical protein
MGHVGEGLEPLREEVLTLSTSETLDETSARAYRRSTCFLALARVSRCSRMSMAIGSSGDRLLSHEPQNLA